ncbi:putative FMN-dependent NADH-azoreductase [Bordetella pertussis STO1-CNMC-0004]|nr:putative FMN-dependent NADH-azoreductase [Bordetella pertussis STO1-CNMC-0004]
MHGSSEPDLRNWKSPHRARCTHLQTQPGRIQPIDSSHLVAELFDADRIVFAVPVYNFNLPAQFKSYIDHIARAGVTFRYTAEGKPEGLVQGKQVLVLIARGGKSEGTPDDTMTPYLKQMLAFLGMTDVTFIAAEGMAMGELAAQEGLALARQRIDALSLDARQGLAAA